MKMLLRNEKGQGIMEYVIISSLIGICCLVAVKEFGQVIQKRVQNIKEQVSHHVDLKTVPKK